MTTETRPELTAMPARIQALPVFRGYPVPWFVAWPNGPEGEPEFRTADGRKWHMAIREKLCWVCGRRLGVYHAFVLGPMCGITRRTSEPPCHRECAVWSAMNCPFLTRPRMVRREGNLPEGSIDAPGMPLDRNPGVALIWLTRNYKLDPIGEGRYLIIVGTPVEIEAYAEGRWATKEEVDASIESGLPHLRAAADADGPEAHKALDMHIATFRRMMAEVSTL